MILDKDIKSLKSTTSNQKITAIKIFVLIAAIINLIFVICNIVMAIKFAEKADIRLSYALEPVGDNVYSGWCMKTAERLYLAFCNFILAVFMLSIWLSLKFSASNKSRDKRILSFIERHREGRNSNI